MTIIEPFMFQFCTAFRERKQLADKLNEVIDYLNNGGGDIPTDIQEQIDEIKSRLDDDETDIDDLETSLTEINGAISELETDIDGKVGKDWTKLGSFYSIENHVTKDVTNQKITLNKDFLIYYTLGTSTTGSIYLSKGTVLDYDSTPLKVQCIPFYQSPTGITIHIYSMVASKLFSNGAKSIDMNGQYFTVVDGAMTCDSTSGTFTVTYSDSLKSSSTTNFNLGYFVR